MPRCNTWTKTLLKKLYKLQEQGKGPKEISKILNRSEKSIWMKSDRMDWDAFNKDPDGYLSNAPKKWTDTEMAQLDAYLQAGKSYEFIADKFGRSKTSVERQAQVTKWEAWRELQTAEVVADENGEDTGVKKYDFDQLVNSLLTHTRNDYDQLRNMTEAKFLKSVWADKEHLPASFEEIRDAAEETLNAEGFGNPASLTFEKGRYIVVGDSHGKHTKKNMFALLRRIDKTLKPDKIIHVGHITDDDKDISYEWGGFDNLIIMARAEELSMIQEQRNKFNFSYDVVREEVYLGDIVVSNQDMITDYVKTPISNVPAEIIDDKAIIGCHRHEFFTRCISDDVSFIASPGSLCERHVVKTIKQINFEEGRVVKQAFHESFAKYRRMKAMYRFWEQGILVVDIGEDGAQTVVPCIIKKTSKGYTTSYFDKIIASSGIFKPSHRTFINADIHSPNHDSEILDIQEQIAKAYKPDAHVNLGDTNNFSSLNHHLMDRGIPILDHGVLNEGAQTHHILKRIASWAKDSYLIYGNHERFAKDFVAKYPQFGEYLDFQFLCGVNDLGYNLISLKDVLKLRVSKYIHGEIRMYGQSGSVLEKAAKTFGRGVFIGHIHYPAIRFGCYSVGFTGLMDQEYNEPNASRWMHGIGLNNEFEKKSFETTIAIINSKCLLGGKVFAPKNPKSWDVKSYKAKLVYDVKGC